MANGLKSRVIYREHGSDVTTWAGSYNLLCKAKEIASPVGEANTYDASTLEDLFEKQEEGRMAAGDQTLESPWTLEDLERLTGLEDTVLDIVILYGSEGKGSLGMLAYTATIKTTPGNATDEHLVLNTKVFPKTQPTWIKGFVANVTEDTYGEVTGVTLTDKG